MPDFASFPSIRTCLASVALAATAALSSAGSSLAQECRDPQATCGELLQAECLGVLGAGSIAAPSSGGVDAADCTAQMASYRACLTEVIEACPATVQQDRGVNEEADALEELGRLGGLIDTPQTVVEFYNNALVFARRGDALSQRKMLEKAIAAGGDNVDLFQRYVTLVKAQEGLIGAREIINDIARRNPENKAAVLAAATLAPAPEREAALRPLVEGGEAEPFAPTWYEIAALYSADRLGTQSLSDKRAERGALEAFEEADEAGKVYRWYLEKDTVEAIRESVRRRLALLRSQNLDIEPVSITAQPSNDSWMISVTILEATTSIRYRIDGGAIRDTGQLENIDPRTGQKMARPFFTLPLGTDEATIDIWYDNRNGEEQGPFPIAFDASAAFVASARSILEGVTMGWIEDRAWDDAQLVYFSHLVSYRCGLSEIRYGVEKDQPDQNFPLQPCDPKDPYSVGDGQEIYLRFSPPVSHISVQLTYADGTTSELRRFDFGD